jgi:hypothetical protein
LNNNRIGVLAKSLSKRVNEYSANMTATPTGFLVFSDVRLTGEYIHAWGTEYNGFLLFEADNSDSFLSWWSSFKDKIRWYVDQTHTIVARKRS